MEAVRYLKTSRLRGKLDASFRATSAAFAERNKSLLISIFPEAWEWEEVGIAQGVPRAVRCCHEGIEEMLANNMPAAQARLEQAFVLANDAGYYYFRAAVNLSIVYVALNALQDAWDTLQEVREVIEEAGERVPRQIQQMVWRNLGFTAFNLYQSSTEPLYLEEADHAYLQIERHFPEHISNGTLIGWAAVKWQSGATSEARRLWREAFQRAEAEENPKAARQELVELLHQHPALREIAIQIEKETQNS